MDGDIVERMRAEEADLSRKLEAVRAFLAAYGHTAGGEDARPQRQPKQGSRQKVPIEGFGAYGRKVVAEAMRVLLTSDHPMRTSDLITPIEAMGVEITGLNKINALGAMLARSIDINSHGKAGWSLANRAVAMNIVAQFGQKENEPSSENAVGSDAGEREVRTFPKPWESTLSHSAGSTS